MKFILNSNDEHAQDCSCSGATFARKAPSTRQVTRCCTTGNPTLKVAPGQRETHVNSYRRQTVHRGKVDQGVSELPRDHVNRPLDRNQKGLALKRLKSRMQKLNTTNIKLI